MRRARPNPATLRAVAAVPSLRTLIRYGELAGAILREATTRVGHYGRALTPEVACALARDALAYWVITHGVVNVTTDLWGAFQARYPEDVVLAPNDRMWSGDDLRRLHPDSVVITPDGAAHIRQGAPTVWAIERADAERTAKLFDRYAQRRREARVHRREHGPSVDQAFADLDRALDAQGQAAAQAAAHTVWQDLVRAERAAMFARPASDDDVTSAIATGAGDLATAMYALRDWATIAGYERLASALIFVASETATQSGPQRAIVAALGVPWRKRRDDVEE